MQLKRGTWAVAAACLVGGCFNPGSAAPLEGSGSESTSGPGSASSFTTAQNTSMQGSGTAAVDAGSDTLGPRETTSETGADTTAADPICGDGVLAAPELCDDANSEDGDGCSASCDTEEGWQCDGASPTQCVAPDLVVRVVGTAFVPRGLQVTYVVTNNGGLASGVYRIDLWDTRTGGFDNPPSPGEDGVLTFTDKPSLAPGGVQNFVDTIPSPVNGTHVAFAVVDSAEEIIEVDDNDNVALGMGWSNAGLVLHRSFASPQVPVEVPADGSLATVGVDVTVPVSVPEIFFSANISHPDVSQLSLRVVAPNGATRPLIVGTPGGTNFASTTIRSGGADIVAAAAPYSGEFEFAGSWDLPPAFEGEWTLEVTDGGSGRRGRINAFSVSFLETDP